MNKWCVNVQGLFAYLFSCKGPRNVELVQSTQFTDLEQPLDGDLI